MPEQKHDPICGFCIVRLGVRPRLRWEPKRRGWVCPVCRAVTRHPSDPNSTATDLEVMFVEGAKITRERQQQAENEWYSKPRVFESGPIEMKGNKKSGRKRRKTLPPHRWYRDYGEV